MREFDLNIETILENWNVANAIREIIANAIDEQTLTKTDAIRIFKDGVGRWHIRDFGRGLQYNHFTQNENQEKLGHKELIGKFGIGLKDALATFDRHGIKVAIDSKHGHFTLEHATKHGFEDITTLHVCVDETTEQEMHGTDFCLEGCTEKDIEEAKKCFICFSGMHPIEGTKYGEIYNNRSGSAEIFVNGIKIADEENFLFSYNISPASKSLKQMLNRERTNVGRSAYAGIVREMLLASRSEEVVKALTENYRRINKGLQCDELKWIDVQGHTAKLLNKRDKVVFLTIEEFQNASNKDREIIERSGREPVFIPAKVKLQIEGAKDDTGTVISTIETVIAAENAAFDYLFVTQEQLDEKERKVFGITTQILKLLSSKIRPSQIFIAEKLKRDDGNGVYEGAKKRIIIKREQLSRVESYLGTLIHELAHAESGYSDLCRGFENKLTEYLGVLAAIVVKNDTIPFVEPTAQDDANRDLLNNQNSGYRF